MRGNNFLLDYTCCDEQQLTASVLLHRWVARSVGARVCVLIVHVMVPE